MLYLFTNSKNPITPSFLPFFFPPVFFMSETKLAYDHFGRKCSSCYVYLEVLFILLVISALIIRDI